MGRQPTQPTQPPTPPRTSEATSGDATATVVPPHGLESDRRRHGGVTMPFSMALLGVGSWKLPLAPGELDGTSASAFRARREMALGDVGGGRGGAADTAVPALAKAASAPPLFMARDVAPPPPLVMDTSPLSADVVLSWRLVAEAAPAVSVRPPRPPSATDAAMAVPAAAAAASELATPPTPSPPSAPMPRWELADEPAVAAL